jgi:hypothetical protein
MLIEDGKLLYLVSDDPKMQEEMRVLENKYNGNTAAEKMPLKPIETPEVKSESNPDNTSHNTSETFDIKKAMVMWNERQLQKNDINSEDKKKLVRTIASYIKSVKDNNQLSYAEKISEFPKNIPEFVRPIYREAVKSRGYFKLTDLLNDESQNFESIFNEILDKLREMIKPYLN